MCVRVRRDRQVALADQLGDARPGNAAQMQQADSPVAQVGPGDTIGCAIRMDRGAGRLAT